MLSVVEELVLFTIANSLFVNKFAERLKTPTKYKLSVKLLEKFARFLISDHLSGASLLSGAFMITPAAPYLWGGEGGGCRLIPPVGLNPHVFLNLRHFCAPSPDNIV